MEGDKDSSNEETKAQESNKVHDAATAKEVDAVEATAEKAADQGDSSEPANGESSIHTRTRTGRFANKRVPPKKRKDDMTEDEAREALQSASDLQSVLQDIKEAVAKDNRRGQEKTDLSGTAKKTPGMHCCVTDCNMSSVNRMLYRFPSEQRDSVQRSKWIEAVSSKDGNNSFQPKEFHKVCEEHFYTGKPSPTNIHPDYVPSLFPWNDKHRPETDEEIKQFNTMMEEKKAEIQAIIEKKVGMLDQMRPRRRKKEPEDFAEVPKRRRGRPAVRLRERSKRLRAVTGRAKILHVEKLEESIESDEDEPLKGPVAYTKYIQVKEELQKQKTFVANLQQMYNASQEQLKEESRKKRMAEIRCKFLEQKNRGLFNRCKEYAEGRVPSGSLASFGVDMDHKTYVERKMRGTQFRERDYDDPNYEMSEEEVTTLGAVGASPSKKRYSTKSKKRSRESDVEDDDEYDEAIRRKVKREVFDEDDETLNLRNSKTRQSSTVATSVDATKTLTSKKLQPVSLGEVPASVKAAFHSVLKEKKQQQKDSESDQNHLAINKQDPGAPEEETAHENLPVVDESPTQVFVRNEKQIPRKQHEDEAVPFSGDITTVTEVVVEDLQGPDGSGGGGGGTSAAAAATHVVVTTEGGHSVLAELPTIPQQSEQRPQQHLVAAASTASAGEFVSYVPILPEEMLTEEHVGGGQQQQLEQEESTLIATSTSSQ